MTRALSKRELYDVHVTRHPHGPDGLCGPSDVVELDGATWDRLWVTLEDGFAPDEPTPYELDEWAARNIMGWQENASTWVRKDDTLAGFQNVIRRQDWKPSVDLGQALECAKATKTRIQFDLLTHGAAIIGTSTSGGKTQYDEFDEYDEANIAEALLRKLHAEVRP